MTIVVAALTERANTIALISDSRISGDAATESGAKIFSLPFEVVVKRGAQFKVRYSTAFGFAFSGSTLSALNTHAFVSTALQNLIVEKNFDLPSLADVAHFCARVSQFYIADVVSRSRNGLIRPERFFFNALLAGYCIRERRARLFQIEPFFDDGAFSVEAVEMNLQPNRAYPIGSGAETFVTLSERMQDLGYARGAYGTMELLLTLGGKQDIGGWIQYGEASQSGFELRPTLRVGDRHPEGNSSITFMGIDVGEFGQVGACNIGYRIMGPVPPLNWLSEALPKFVVGNMD